MNIGIWGILLAIGLFIVGMKIMKWVFWALAILAILTAVYFLVF